MFDKKKTSTPEDLLFDQLHDLLSMETQLVEALPRLAPLCTDEALRKLVVSHAVETEQHREIVMQILRANGIEIKKDKCKAIAGLIEGGETHLKGVDAPETRDLMMIAHCLRVEHYEIAAYEITSRLGEQLGFNAESRKLADTLAQETETAESLLAMEPRLFAIAQSPPQR